MGAMIDVLCMKTIDIRRTTKARLVKMIDRKEIKSMDGAVSRLLDMSKHTVIDNSRSNIHLHKDTYDRLMSFKAYPTESHNETLSRLLDEMDKKQ